MIFNHCCKVLSEIKTPFFNPIQIKIPMNQKALLKTNYKRKIIILCRFYHGNHPLPEKRDYLTKFKLNEFLFHSFSSLRYHTHIHIPPASTSNGTFKVARSILRSRRQSGPSPKNHNNIFYIPLSFPLFFLIYIQSRNEPIVLCTTSFRF